jgi:hypothetical protein
LIGVGVKEIPTPPEIPGGIFLKPCEVLTWQGFFMEVNMLDRFKEFRIELLDRIERMESLSSLRESGKVRENLAEIREKLSQNRGDHQRAVGSD